MSALARRDFGISMNFMMNPMLNTSSLINQAAVQAWERP